MTERTGRLTCCLGHRLPPGAIAALPQYAWAVVAPVREP